MNINEYLTKKILTMSLQFKKVSRVFPYDKTKTQRFLTVPDRGQTVEYKDLCKQVALISGINRGNVTACIDALVEAMTTYIEQGHPVKISDFGTFRPSFNAKSKLKIEDTGADNIYRMKIQFISGKRLKDMINSLSLIDNTPKDPKESDSPDEV